MTIHTERTRGVFGWRLLAEFTVIVVGVLVALAADSALEVRAEHRQEEAYYHSLVRDLASDTAEYGFAMRITARSVETARYVRSVVLGNPLPTTRPLSKALYYASYVNYPDWSSGTVEELYSAGTIRLVRDRMIKDALHAYRAEVNEWRPRMQGEENRAFLDYRMHTAGLVPLEAAIAYELTSFHDERASVEVDEEALARRIVGDVELLRDLERMILQWAALTSMYEVQRTMAVALLDLLRERVGVVSD